MTPKNIYGWDGFELSSGDLKVGLTPSIGGRIMSLVYKNQELLFIDPTHYGEVFNPTQWQELHEAKRALGFRVWGGDKTWIAPQSKWFEGIPPLDLDAAPYTIQFQDDTAIMTSPICRETGLQIIRRVSLEAGQVHLVEEMCNKSSQPLKRGLWNVTQINRPVSFEIPSNGESFRSYHQEDPSLPAYAGQLSGKDGRLTIDCSNNNLFKVGGMPKTGEIAIRIPSNNKEIVWKKIFNYQEGFSYAHGSAVEIFNSPSYPYAEIELHAPLRLLLPSEFVQFKQNWQIDIVENKALNL